VSKSLRTRALISLSHHNLHLERSHQTDKHHVQLGARAPARTQRTAACVHGSRAAPSGHMTTTVASSVTMPSPYNDDDGDDGGDDAGLSGLGFVVVEEEDEPDIPLHDLFPGATIVAGVGADTCADVANTGARHTLHQVDADASSTAHALHRDDDNDDDSVIRSAHTANERRQDGMTAEPGVQRRDKAAVTTVCTVRIVTSDIGASDTRRTRGVEVEVAVGGGRSDVEADVARGRVVLILGPTASGKTTLLSDAIEHARRDGVRVVSNEDGIGWDPTRAVVSQFGTAVSAHAFFLALKC
jgi:hypothetical protein